MEVRVIPKSTNIMITAISTVFVVLMVLIVIFLVKFLLNKLFKK